ncbi:hypothetical protein CBFG_00154 [Clostridiales bacterium 1_7_47FAA]|nr:hypothetical protein CBFG_00154 [Clostridiales bacterium 1_7_47FAA]
MVQTMLRIMSGQLRKDRQKLLYAKIFGDIKINELEKMLAVMTKSRNPSIWIYLPYTCPLKNKNRSPQKVAVLCVG